jgi:hypothetical protein
MLGIGAAVATVVPSVAAREVEAEATKTTWLANWNPPPHPMEVYSADMDILRGWIDKHGNFVPFGEQYPTASDIIVPARLPYKKC